MDEAQERRLKRYFLNSDRFLWGLSPTTQKDTYQWLFNNGFRERILNDKRELIGERVYRGAYDTVANALTRDYGIEKIVRFVYEVVQRGFGGEENLKKLRDLWEKAEVIKPKAVEKIQYRMVEDKNGKLEPIIGGCTFFDTDSRYEGMRWSNFAGVWFEEIEPWAMESHSHGKE